MKCLLKCMIGAMGDLRVSQRPCDGAPSEEQLRSYYADEGMRPYRWSKGPGYRYSSHAHRHHKAIYVVSGSITFGLTDLGMSCTLQPGDGLDLPEGVRQDATVVPDGVVCLEGHQRPSES